MLGCGGRRLALAVGLLSQPGTYLLVLELQRAVTVEAGRLGRLEMEAGWYGYVGSAFGPGGVAARCGHHLGLAVRPHWHIDYLRRVADLREIWVTYDLVRREHDWAGLLVTARGSRIPVPGFGASDCACPSHLFRYSRRPSFEGFRRRVRQRLSGHAMVRRVEPGAT